jgi:hypothetical protein
MKKIFHLIYEAKQVGDLYHVMDVEKFVNLLNYDVLKKPTSFTRNKDYDYVAGREKNYTYQIKIDGNKLSNNYKISPINQGKGWVYDEYEEIVNVDIKDVGKYILDIIIISKKRFSWKEKGFDKVTYNLWKYSRIEEISKDLSNYISNYPNIKLKIKNGHGGKIHDLDYQDLKWLRTMGILNPKESEIENTVVGLYKDKKLVLKDLSKLRNYILKNKNQFYVNDYDKFGNPNGKIPISKLDDEEPYWDSFLQDPEDFCVDFNNNYVILRQIRDKNNRIMVLILHNKNTVKDLPYYKSLVSKTGKESKTIDVPTSLDDYYDNLETEF